MALDRINELKTQDFNRKLQEMKLNQTRELEERERSHMLDYQNFNQKWDHTLMTIQQQDAQTMNDLAMKHNKSLENHRFDMENKLPLSFKYSPELLNHIKMQE